MRVNKLRLFLSALLPVAGWLLVQGRGPWIVGFSLAAVALVGGLVIRPVGVSPEGDRRSDLLLAAAVGVALAVVAGFTGLSLPYVFNGFVLLVVVSGIHASWTLRSDGHGRRRARGA